MDIKKSAYNIIFGLISQIFTIGFGILLPRLFLVNFGSEVNGLLSSISQVFVYIGLLEAGVGAATIQALYGVVANNDKLSINEILAATNKYYKKTGILYFFAILIFALVYPLFVSSEIPKLIIIFVILLNGLGGVINYLFQGKYRLLLQAEGKGYVLTNLGTILSILSNGLKIVFISQGYNIIVVQTIHLVFNILQMIYVEIYIRKHYSWINMKVKPNFESISQKKFVLIHQIAALVFNNTDIIILTIFCNLKVVSIYAIYLTLLSMVGMITGNVSSGVTFVLGQTFNSDRNKFIKIFDAFELYYMSLVFALYLVAYIFILPFLKLYTSGITDINYIDGILPTLFIAISLISNGRASSIHVINISGHFKETRNQAILEATINLIISVILVNLIGIYGVLIGTIVASIERTIYFVLYTNKKILGRNPNYTFKRWIRSSIIFIILAILSKSIKLNLDTYPQIIAWSAIFSLFSVFTFFTINSIFEKEIFRYTENFIKFNLNLLLIKLKHRFYANKQ